MVLETHFKNIGSVTDAATGVSSFKPLQYAKNVGAGMASDQKEGYFGAFGGGTGKFDVNTGQFVNYAGGGTQGFNPLAPKRITVAKGDTLSDIARKNNTSVDKLKALNGLTSDVIQPGQIINTGGGNIFNKTGDLIRNTTGIGDGKPGALGFGGEGSFFGMKTPGVIKAGEDAIKGLLDGGGGGGSGINPQMAALALLYGKATKDAAERNKGGLTDIRNSLRPDLKAAPVFQGYDLGVRRAAMGGAINNYRFGGAAESNIPETKQILFERKQEIMDTLADRRISKSRMKNLNEELRAINIELAGNFNQGMTRNARKNNEAMRRTLQGIRGEDVNYRESLYDVQNRQDNEKANQRFLKMKALESAGIGRAGLPAYQAGGLAELDMRNGGPSNGPGTGTSDDIPAMLSDGEFVMTAAANNGAGGFDFLKTREGLELIPTGKPNRKKGVQVMNNLMDVFENYNETGRMA